MPFANGLKLIENAYHIKPDIQCVIISGYEDFHYAQEAIRLNVSSYLTKPIDENSILAMLQKLSLKTRIFHPALCSVTIFLLIRFPASQKPIRKRKVYMP